MKPAYRAPWWLPGPHLQTLWPLLRKPPMPELRRERWTTPDDDFIDLDWLPHRPGAPLLVLFHGLEGSSRSHYARSILSAAAAAGWNGVVPHFRGCSGEANRLARAYHSGDSEELDWILRRLAAGHGRPLYVAGISLGGNALLKWLGERGAAAGELVSSAAAICPPLDLAISGHALARGFNRVYTWHFLSTLKLKALGKLARACGRFDPLAVERARTLRQFDDAYTAPLHGFSSADDYWTRASARPWVHAIVVPTLLLVCDNDPFVPPAAWPETEACATTVSFERLRGGGHVGLVSGRFPGHLRWLPQRLLEHFGGTAAATARDNSRSASPATLG